MHSTQDVRPTLPVDDPRHGDNAGYNAGCREECCKRAHARYKNLRIMGRTRTYVDGLGSRRRLQALAAMGYSISDLSLRLGYSRTYLGQILKGRRVRSDNAANIAQLYDELCMTLSDHPLATRARRHAQHMGWVPPLAWDDIDTDEAPAVSSFTEFEVDDVKVRRVLDGIRQDCTPAERIAILNAWTRPLRELEALTGWNIHRLRNERKLA